ncbi:MAG: hypothetical protein HY864_12205 [Chloroflexi bacterium]|nr:hypothetical protein [Chloroflexota bacterium]
MKINRTPIPFLALSLLAFIFALWAGLLRLGWQIPTPVSSLAMLHGPLMISGFLGALIALERVVALKIRWMYGVPLLAATGWLVSLLVQNQPFGPILLTAASLGGVVILGHIVRREFALHAVVMFLGSLAWLLGNILWLTGSAIFQVVFWWQAFLILTICGERLELNRVLKPSRRQQNIFAAVAFVFIAGVIVTLFNLQLGTRLSGLGMLALAVWSVPNDIAWRNLRHRLPLTRYIAWCLALGFLWMGTGGAINLVYGAQAAGPRYDAALHAVFVGFVISMIFGHAPIIFPALLGVPINFQKSFYIHLTLLHISLALRLAGDLANQFTVRMWGGLLNEVAILLFLGMTIYSVSRSLKQDSVFKHTF